MDAFFHFLGVLVMCVAGLIALTLILLVAVSFLPNSPWKDIVKAIAKRIGATAAVGLVAIPIEPIPGVDVAYDIGGLIFLLIYWFGIFREIRNAFHKPPKPPSEPPTYGGPVVKDVQGTVIDNEKPKLPRNLRSTQTLSPP